MKFKKLTTFALAALLTCSWTQRSRAALSYFVDPNNWPAGWYDAAVANMQTVVNLHNAYGEFATNNSGNIYVYYNAGIPTAQAGYGPYGGSIGVGGTYPNVRVLLHESAHWLGTGTLSTYWGGPAASAIVQQFDGVGATMGGDSAHFWPYGHNYDNEASPINDARHVAIVYALRKDFGVGATASPSAASAVAMTASDAAGTSGFNYNSGWSDGHFPQPGTTYSTSNFLLRTPAATPSWTFAGESLTVNNTNGASGGLQYNGQGATGAVTFKNLILNGGYVRHGSASSDIFQLAGKVTLTGTPVIDAAQGNINVSAAIVGTGALTKTGGFTLTVSGGNTYAGATAINAGTLRLANATPLASYAFDSASGNTVPNLGAGGAAMNGTLAGGASIVAGGKYGNAVRLVGGGSVDINNPITDLGNAANWTVSAWVRTTTAGGTFLDKGDGVGWTNGNTLLYLGDGTAGGSGGIPSGVRYAGGFFQGSTAATPVNDGNWHQVTYVNSGGNYALYTDGVAQPLSAGNAGFSNADVGSIVRLGVSTNTVPGDGTINYNGFLDNVQVFNAALSPGQVAGLYSGVNSGPLPTTTNVSIAAGASLDVNGVNQTIGALSGAVGSTIKLGSGGQLAVSSALNGTFAGSISGTAGASLTKSGAGTLTLSGVNTYAGTTTINGGTLQLSAAAPVVPATPIASFNFSNILGNVVVNGGSGGAGMNGTLVANGGTGSLNTTGGPGAGMGALVLNGTGTTVDVNSGITDLSSGSTWTVSAWIKTTQAGATILNKGNGAGWNSGYSTFYLGDGSDAGSGGIPDAVRWGGGWLAGSTPVNDGNWHLVTYTNAAGVKSIYVDGVPDSLSQSQFLNTDTGTKVRIGFAPTNVDGELTTNGSLSGINIYNSALTPSQVAALYNGVVGGAGGALPLNTNVVIASGGTLDVNGIVQQIGSLTGAAGSAVALGAGQLSVNSAANTQFAGVISGAGGSLVKQGAGALTLAGANLFSGPTTVALGKLLVDGSIAGAATVQNGGTLGGNGTIAGAIAVQAGGVFSPGASAGTLTVGGLALAAGSFFDVEIGASSDHVVVNGGVVALDGTLRVSLLGGFVPAAGQTFSLLEGAPAAMTGAFQALQLPALSDMLWDTALVNSAAQLTVVAPDFNGDFTVNDLDFGVLLLHYGLQAGATRADGDANGDGAVNGGDYLLVQRFFGAALPSATANVAAVPEPTALALAALAALFAAPRRRT